MKVECRISQENDAPHAVICARRMTPSLAQAIALLESEDSPVPVLPGRRDDKIFFLQGAEIDLIRSEGREIVCYDTDSIRSTLSSPLYELEEMLRSDFVRISKSALVRIAGIDHVEASFHGTMRLVMRSHLEEYISRSYRKTFRERLGI